MKIYLVLYHANMQSETRVAFITASSETTARIAVQNASQVPGCVFFVDSVTELCEA